MSKITLPTVASGYNLSVINSNFQAIEDTLNDSVLFRDEDVSNEMSTNLDMNGFSIYNVNAIDSDAVTVGGVPLAEHIASLAVSFDPNDLTIARYVKTITIASATVTLPETYGGTASSLMVFRNGVQQPSSHYTFDGSDITFSTALAVGEVVDVVYFKSVVSAIGAAEIGDVSGLTEALAAKQATLVSGVNIRTINGNNILGGGDLVISGGSGGSGTVTSVAMSVPTGLTVSGSPITSSGTFALGLDTGYSIPTTTKQSEWDAKQVALVSGTNIKTINGTSVLGSGDIVISGGAGGTVTSVSVVSANGFGGTVATATSTPAITLTTNLTGLLKGNGTAMSAATAGTDYVAPSGALGTPSSGTLTNCTADGTNAVGFRNIPQVSQSAAYTAVLSDAGKHILHPSADTTARTFTIPANASVAYPIGTALTFINQNAAGVVTIAITSDTMRLAGAGTTGSRTLAANGVATAIKLTSTEWIISGTGLT